MGWGSAYISVQKMTLTRIAKGDPTSPFQGEVKSRFLRLNIPTPLRRERRKIATVGLEIDQRGFVEAIKPAHQHARSFDADEFDDRGADRIGSDRRAQRKCAARLAVFLRALQHDVARRAMQPVDHFQMRVEIDAHERRHPRLKNLDPADRAIMAALPRRLLTQFPGGADPADEDETGVVGRGHIDGDLALAQFGFYAHRLSPMKCFAP